MPTSRDSLALTVDLGTSGLKVGLVTLGGALAAVRHVELATTFGKHGEVRQDALDWWDQIAAMSRSLIAPIDPSRIVAVGITGQYGSTVPVDESGSAVADCVMWMDTRGGRHTRAKVGGPVSGYTPRAVYHFVTKTGGAPSPSGADATGSILHLLHDRPEVMSATRWLLEPVDYLAMRFSGVPATTHASMVGAWLTDNRRLSGRRYDPTLLRLLGIPGEKLAPLVGFGEITGCVTAAASEVTGLPQGVAVIAGMPDLHAAALGSGTTAIGGPGHLALSTTSWISAPMPRKKTDIFHSIATIPGLDEQSYLIANNHEIGAKALEWFARSLGLSTPIDFDALTSEAGSASPGSGGILFTPWLAGERSPVESHSARGGFHNLSLATGRPQMIRAVMEGVAYNSRWLAEYVDRFAGRRLEPLRVLGGGARSALWCQIHADVMGRTIEQVSDPMTAQLRGCALLAGRSLGVLSDGEIPSLATIAQRFEPDPSTSPAYDRLYAEFPKLIKTQRPMFQRLQRRGG